MRDLDFDLSRSLQVNTFQTFLYFCFNMSVEILVVIFFVQPPAQLCRARETVPPLQPVLQ